MVNYLSCWACSPQSSSYWTITTRAPAACEWFCDAVFEECGDISVPLAGTTEVTTMRETFTDGTAFCQANGFSVLAAADGGNSPLDLDAACYQPRDGVDRFAENSAAASSAPLGLWTAAALLTALFAPRGGSTGGAHRGLLLLAVVLGVLALAPGAVAQSSDDFPPSEFCPYFNNRAPMPQAGGTNCTWYAESSCCSREEVADLTSSAIPLVGASGECTGAMQYHTCWPCAPYQQHFYDRSAYRVTMCESWCDVLLSKCSGAQFKGQTVSERFATGADFCRALHFQVSAANDFSSCFMKASDHGLSSSAAAASASSAALLAAAAAAGVLGGPGRRFGVVSVLVVAAMATLLPSAAAMSGADVKAAATRLGAKVEAVAEATLSEVELQALYDGAASQGVPISAADFTAEVAAKLNSFFSSKVNLVNTLAVAAGSAVDTSTPTTVAPAFEDMDVPSDAGLAALTYSTPFKANVDNSSSWVKLPDAVDRNSDALKADLTWTEELQSNWVQNLNGDPDLRWQYIGTPNGMFRNLPGYQWGSNWQGLPSDYDPRFRPWYAGAVSGPKDLVVVVDCSSSMRNWLSRAKAAVGVILDTMSTQDHVQVVCSRGSYWSYSSEASSPDRPRETGSIGCIKDRMLPATNSILNDFKERVNTMVADGATSFGSGITKAYSLLTAGGRRGCQRIIVYVGDGTVDDGDGVRCGPGSTRRVCSSSSSGGSSCSNKYTPGPQCEGDLDAGWSAASTAMRRDSELVIMGVTVSDSPRFASQLACDIGNGVHLRVRTTADVATQMSPYFAFLASRSPSVAPVVSAPYVDSSGLGLIMTISQSVSSDGTLHGVVGLDVSLGTVEALVSNARWGNVYGFLINTDGEAIVHPLLKPTSSLTSDPIFPDVELLEGTSPGFLAVRDAMKAGETGNATVRAQTKRFPAGDPLEGSFTLQGDWQYHYAPIPGSQLSFALVFSVPDDLTRHVLESEHNATTTTSPPLGVDFYHQLDKYIGSGAVVPGLETDLNATIATGEAAASSPYPDLYVTSSHSAWKLSPAAFCNPTAYLEDVGAGNVPALHSFVNTWGSGRMANNGCQGNVGTSSARVVQEVRPELELTQRMDAVWKARSGSDVDATIWTYYGSTAGMHRAYPGHRFSIGYDPTQRPWFHRAVANPGLVSVSTPYLDASGAGRVSTISVPVFAGKPAAPAGACGGGPACPCATNTACDSGKCYNGTCSATRVVGVVGVDFTYTHFNSEVLSNISASLPGADGTCSGSYSCPGPDGTSIPCTTQCYLMDTAGLMVVADSFAIARGTDEYAFSGVGLSRVEGPLAAALQASGVLVRSELTDYQGACAITPAFANAPSSTVNLTLTPAQSEEGRGSLGKFSPFGNSFGCTEAVSSYSVDTGAFAAQATDDVLEVAYQTGCAGGTARITAVPGTNTYLVVVSNRYSFEGDPFRFACHAAQWLPAPGSTRVLNGSCAEVEDTDFPVDVGTCPALQQADVKCEVEDGASAVQVGAVSLLGVALASMWIASQD